MKTLLRLLTCVLAVAVALASCHSAPAATPVAPTPVPTSTPEAATHARAPALPDSLIDEFLATVEAELAYYHIPGGAVVLVSGGQLVRVQGFGVRDVATGEPFTPETQFRPGSTGKSMTSFMLAQLVDQGLLGWDTPVTQIMPSFQTSDPALTARLTVRDLMGMGSGLVSDATHALYWRDWDVEDLLAAIAAQPVEGAYRQFYSYNNELYAAAAYLGLAAAGQKPTLPAYAAWMREHVTGPIGMRSAVLTDDPGALGANRSQSYGVTLLGGAEVPWRMPDAPIGVIGPAGGWWMSILDMARYLITQMNGVTPDGARIVSAENLAETWRPGVEIPDEELSGILRARYAMGWMVGDYREVAMRLHGGGWKGYQTMMAVYPDHNVGLLIFANHAFGSAASLSLALRLAEMLGGLEPKIVSALHQRFESDLRQGAGQTAQLPAYDIVPQTVAPLLGRYEGDWSVELRADQTLWLARPGWEYLLYPLASPVNAFMAASSESMGSRVLFRVEGEDVLLEFPDVRLSVAKVAD